MNYYCFFVVGSFCRLKGGPGPAHTYMLLGYGNSENSENTFRSNDTDPTLVSIPMYSTKEYRKQFLKQNEMAGHESPRHHTKDISFSVLLFLF